VTTTVQQDDAKVWVIPGLVILCLYMGLSLYHNGLVLRVALAFRNDAVGSEYATIATLAVIFTLAEIAAAFASIALLALVRRSFVPYVVAASLLFCGMPGYWLQNLVLSAVSPGHQPILGDMTALVLLDLVIAMVGAVWLLKSRNVRTFFDHRLLPQTFD
jgi:hypothetical protein